MVKVLVTEMSCIKTNGNSSMHKEHIKKYAREDTKKKHPYLHLVYFDVSSGSLWTWWYQKRWSAWVWTTYQTQIKLKYSFCRWFFQYFSAYRLQQKLLHQEILPVLEFQKSKTNSSILNRLTEKQNETNFGRVAVCPLRSTWLVDSILHESQQTTKR